MDTPNVDIERTPDGRRLVVSRNIDTPRERAWELLTDTDRWPAWGPSVTAVDCDSRFIQSGTRGRVQLPLGIWVPFEITTCADYRWTWRVARIPATGHRVDETDAGCRVCFELPVLAAGYAPVCGRALTKIANLLAEKRA
jgi:hypothetical protein